MERTKIEWSRSIKGLGSAGLGEGQSATSHFRDCTEKPVWSYSCPRLGSDFRTKVNAESKSFPEGTRCSSDPSEWLSRPVVEVNLCRSVENEYMFPPNIDHIQHLSLQQPAETQQNINFQKCMSSTDPHPLVRSSCADLKGRAERSLKLVALGRTQGVQAGWASLPEPAAPTITLCVWFGLGLQPPQALRLKSPQPSSMWQGEFW